MTVTMLMQQTWMPWLNSICILITKRNHVVCCMVITASLFYLVSCAQILVVPMLAAILPYWESPHVKVVKCSLYLNCHTVYIVWFLLMHIGNGLFKMSYFRLLDHHIHSKTIMLSLQDTPIFDIYDRKYIYKVFTLIKVPTYKHYDRINDSWLLMWFTLLLSYMWPILFNSS